MPNTLIGADSGGPVSTIPRPRTIVTTDPELDDLNSLIRLLLYSNEIEIEGLIYASSRYHWRGDGKGTAFFLPDREYTTPQTSWRWAPGERFIHDAVDAYAEAFNNLRQHDPRYPEPAHLRSLIRDGNVDFEGDTSAESSGSQLIAAALLDDRPGPLFLQMWAGPSTVARALMSVEERFSSTNDWPAVRAAVSAKAVITKYGSQDATFGEYITPVWPDIQVLEVATVAWGYGARHMIRPADHHLLAAEWMRTNVTQVGSLGSLYRVWGDGRQMVAGDEMDYFHHSGQSGDELRALGYQVWMDPCPAGEWISEGDSTNMLNLLVPSLRAHEHPTYGGWGGRYVRASDGTNTWELVDAAFRPSSEGIDRLEIPGNEDSVVRWFADAQADFAARLRWTVTSYEEANHHPRIQLLGDIDRDVDLGTTVSLTVTVSDPDGDVVAVSWWIDEDASTCSVAPLLAVQKTAADVHIPEDATSRETIHIIVQAVDDSPTPLKAYQRVILTIR